MNQSSELEPEASAPAAVPDVAPSPLFDDEQATWNVDYEAWTISTIDEDTGAPLAGTVFEHTGDRLVIAWSDGSFEERRPEQDGVVVVRYLSVDEADEYRQPAEGS